MLPIYIENPYRLSRGLYRYISIYIEFLARKPISNIDPKWGLLRPWAIFGESTIHYRHDVCMEHSVQLGWRHAINTDTVIYSNKWPTLVLLCFDLNIISDLSTAIPDESCRPFSVPVARHKWTMGISVSHNFFFNFTNKRYFKFYKILVVTKL